ncbi:hypothetical protein HDU96_001103, partial [Phlyctochytrium bullatum]
TVSLATTSKSNPNLPSESHFDPQAYLEDLHRESRHAALLAQPSTPSTIKAVFENDPDAIVPYSWIHGSSTFPAPGSSTALLDAVLNTETANHTTENPPVNTCKNNKTVSWACKSDNGYSSATTPATPTSNNDAYRGCKSRPAALLAGESHTTTQHLPTDNATTNNSDATSRRREGKKDLDAVDG